MRGEELQGLNIEELQQLEKALEAGLTRVIETKVVFYLLLIDVKSSKLYDTTYISRSLRMRDVVCRVRRL